MKKVLTIVVLVFAYISGQTQIYNNFEIIKHELVFIWPSEKNSNHSSSYWLRGLNSDYLIEPRWVLYEEKIIDITDSLNQNSNNQGCIQVTEGDSPQHCLHYLIRIGQDTIIADSENKLKKIYCPIKSEIEAISFVFAIANYRPFFDLDFLNKKEWIENDVSHKWVSYQSKVETSYVNKTNDGFELLLYWYQTFGCEHPYYSAIINVKSDGTITIRNRKKAFEDSRNPNECVD